MDIVYVLDNIGNLTFLNDVGYRALHATPDDVLGRPLLSWIHPDDRDRTRAAMSQVGEQGRNDLELKNRLVDSTGKVRLVLHKVRMVRNEDGEVIASQGTAQEVGDSGQQDPAGSLIEDHSPSTGVSLRLILDSTDEGIYTVDLEGNCTLINQAALQMLGGYEEREVLGQNMHELLHFRYPDGSPYPLEKCPIYRAFAVGQGVRLDKEVFWRRDRTSFPVEYSSYPIMKNGAIQGAVITFMDISERKRMEDALRGTHSDLEARVAERTAELHESEERYLTLLHGIPQKVFYKDRGSVYLAVNSSYAQDFGLSPRDFVGRTDFDFFPAGLAEKYRRDDRLVMDCGSPRETDESYVRNGERRLVHTLKTPVLDEKGQVTGVLGVFWDVTERRQAEMERERLLGEVKHLAEVAQRRAAELQGVLDSMVDAVYVCNTEGRITLTNNAGMLLLGITHADQDRSDLSQFTTLLHARHLDGTPLATEDLPLARALSGETVELSDEVVFNPKTQRDFFVRVTAAPIRDERGVIVAAVAVARDMTELMELDRLKDQFISTAAHELKTPVTSIKGYAQHLLRDQHVERGPLEVKALQAIDRQTDRISGLVNDLLDISRLQSGQLELTRERINLLQLVEEVVDRTALITPKHHLRVVKAEPVIVQGDPGRLEEVLINLLDNAIRYSPQSGSVDVSVTVRDRQATVAVRDYGIGIPRDKQARIYQRFYRAHIDTPYDYGGMGVGLYISQEIIHRHGGRMCFESEEGNGSTFLFALPVAGTGP